MTRPVETLKERDGGLLGKLVEDLRELPGVDLCAVEVASDGGDLGADARIDAVIQGRPFRILVQVRGSGYPRDLALVAHRLLRLRESRESVIVMVAVPAISPGGRDFLRQEGIGYWDSGGSLYLEAPGVFCLIERPLPPAAERHLKNPYTGRSAQVLHALLMNPEREWEANRLAKLAGVSPYTAHLVLKFLEDQLWVERHGVTSWRLREPGRLLDAWADAYTLRQYQHRRFYIRQPSWSALRKSIVAQLETKALDYALTLGSGGELVAPFLTNISQLHVIMDPKAPLDDVTEAMRLTPVEDGENVIFLVPRSRSPLMFRQRVEDTWVASNVQLYLDLHALPLRGKEQAEHLRAEKLPF